ncbi:MAG: NAD(P)H-hydrate dehydratase [Candidatus Gottesmanbacteria bacterium]|nr:NAD(P)H-hydrate dehydratase [Candidatus Gottesmanbacteria bacterium]
MESVTIDDVKKISLPQHGSHKGQNGRLLVIGGSHLFHAASLWALTVASRIVDLVHYSSVPENNAIVHEEKKEFRNGIVVPRGELGPYIEEDDCILIGPGMTRDAETEMITNTLFAKYPDKQWVIDAGSLQMMDVTLIPKNAILTPHHGEFAHAFGSEDIAVVAKKYQCIVLLKGEKDVVSDGNQTREIRGGNPGMTKGGTGDVLAGIIAALACTNDPFLATIAGSFINKRAGDALYKKVGPYFNATDLANQIRVC